MGKVDRFAFTPDDEEHNTGVDLSSYPTVVIGGYYRDATERKHNVKRTYNYPPSQE